MAVLGALGALKIGYPPFRRMKIKKKILEEFLSFTTVSHWK